MPIWLTNGVTEAIKGKLSVENENVAQMGKKSNTNSDKIDARYNTSMKDVNR